MNSSGIKDMIETTKKILASSGIHGCITGSSMLDCEFDYWDSAPDVDIFAYNEQSFSHAVMTLRSIGYMWGDGSTESARQSCEWYNRSLEDWYGATQWKNNQGVAMITVKLNQNGVVVNVTWKKGCDNVFDVLKSFDMTIIMVGFDIQSRTIVDLRNVRRVPQGENINVPVDAVTRIAHLNPLRKLNTSIWNHWKWVRQCDRPMNKYQQRGFDCTEVVHSYNEMITNDINAIEGPIDNPDIAKVIEDMKDIKAKMDIWEQEYSKEV